MRTIRVTAQGPERFRVDVEEGTVRTSHEVAVPGRFLDDLGLSGVPRERVVRETFVFLLEREPSTSVLARFGIEQVADYFPEYYGELRTRLGT